MTRRSADTTRLTGEIGKLLGAKWKELDDDEKKVCALVSPSIVLPDWSDCVYGVWIRIYLLQRSLYARP